MALSNDFSNRLHLGIESVSAARLTEKTNSQQARALTRERAMFKDRQDESGLLWFISAKRLCSTPASHNKTNKVSNPLPQQKCHWALPRIFVPNAKRRYRAATPKPEGPATRLVNALASWSAERTVRCVSHTGRLTPARVSRPTLSARTWGSRC